MTIGILSAMPEETQLLERELKREKESVHAGRRYYMGEMERQRVVVVFSRMGKVAAAATAQHLIDVYKVGSIVFSGVAGGLSPELRVGDVVVANRLWQHDMDASPLFPALEVPLLGVSSFEADLEMRERLAKSAAEFLSEGFESEVGNRAAEELGIREPRVVAGDIASGDQFIAGNVEQGLVRARVPSALCVEMEGGAVAQVCFENGIPLGVVRVISDGAGEGAHVDFGKFVVEAASRYGLGIVRRYLAGLASGGCG